MMNRFIECYDTKALSPVYDNRPAVMAAGLPCDELTRGVTRARELRRKLFEEFVGDVRNASARAASDAGEAVSRWVEGLHRGPFTSNV